jgi:CO dehydrogenase/acetyl-CoA synthase delta subunit
MPPDNDFQQSTAGAEDLARKIAAKATAALAPLEREMRLMQWPGEFQVILWEVVAAQAMELAKEASANVE